MPYSSYCCSILHIANNLKAGLWLPPSHPPSRIPLPWWTHSRPSRLSNAGIYNSQVEKKAL